MRLETTACIILASGFSRRFGAKNKLLSPFKGKPLAAHCAALAAALPVHTTLGIIQPGDRAMADLFGSAGIGLMENPKADAGQGASLSLAVRHIEPLPVTAAIVLLADMPFVSARHIETLVNQIGESDAAASQHNNVLQPPLLFARSVFPQLRKLSGDRGGKAVLNSLEHVEAVEMNAHEATDIDTPEKLAEYTGN
ncbi:MAG: nucleotidyltransferase family protein [Candidatus Phaeomarinobacter sp.]